MRTVSYILICFAGFVIGFGIGRAVKKKPPLPSIMEIQERIGCMKIDGILGDETQLFWDMALNNQEAAIWLNKNTMKVIE